MAINYQYPRLGVLASDDLIVVADISDDNATKTVTAQQIADLGGGGGGGVTDFTSTAGTFVSVTANSAATGSVSIGTVDLSATGTPSASTFLRGDNTWSTTGDVVGPASAIDLSIPVFDGTTGKLLKDATGVIIDANGNVILNNWPETDAEFRGDVDGGVRFTAQATETIAKGDVVYISGAAGDNTQVRKARADSASTMTSFGFAFNAATSGGTVQVVTLGNIYGSGTYPLDTTIDSDGNAITVGDTLYVSPITYGGWTNVRPTGAADLVQNIGEVVRVNANNGAIKVGGAGRSNDTPNTISTSGNITSLLNIEGASIIKTGGTSSQFLKADGSVDSSTYLANVVEDTTPQLGGALDANAKNITNAGTVQADQFQAILNSITSVSGAATLNAQNGVYAELTLNEDCSLTITNLGVGTPAVIKVTQDAVSSFNITSYVVSGGTVKWPGGSVPTITTNANSIDIITFISDGVYIYASIVQDFK